MEGADEDGEFADAPLERSVPAEERAAIIASLGKQQQQWQRDSDCVERDSDCVGVSLCWVGLALMTQGGALISGHAFCTIAQICGWCTHVWLGAHTSGASHTQTTRIPAFVHIHVQMLHLHALTPAPSTHTHSHTHTHTHTESSWELAVVFDFLHLFRRHLGELASEDMLILPRQLTEELVDSTGADGLLAQVHVAVLNGVIHKGGLTPTTWQAYLALKARYERVQVDGAWQPLFKARKREEAYAYCHLAAEQRCVGGGVVLCRDASLVWGSGCRDASLVWGSAPQSCDWLRVFRWCAHARCHGCGRYHVCMALSLM